MARGGRGAAKGDKGWIKGTAPATVWRGVKTRTAGGDRAKDTGLGGDGGGNRASAGRGLGWGLRRTLNEQTSPRNMKCGT
jgi:hypothetical protein